VTVTGATARRRRSIGRWLRQNSSRSPTSAPGRRRFATVVVPEHVHQLRMVLVVDKREAQVVRSRDRARRRTIASLGAVEVCPGVGQMGGKVRIIHVIGQGLLRSKSMCMYRF
jgi:hypothetical protein